MAKLTPMQALFKKQIKRLQREIQREYRKTGVELDRSLIPEMPKRVTQKALRDIKAIKPKDLRRQSQYVDYETGEQISYEEAVERVRNKRTVETPQRIDMMGDTVERYFQSIEKWNNTFQSIMHSWIDSLIATHGKDEVAVMLWTGMSEGLIVTKEIVYEEDKRQAYMSDMMKFLGMPKEIKAAVLDEMEKEIGFELPS